MSTAALLDMCNLTIEKLIDIVTTHIIVSIYLCVSYITCIIITHIRLACLSPPPILADDEALVLAVQRIQASAAGSDAVPLMVSLTPFILEASFGSLAWSGSSSGRAATPAAPTAVNARIVGAQVCCGVNCHHVN